MVFTKEYGTKLCKNCSMTIKLILLRGYRYQNIYSEQGINWSNWWFCNACWSFITQGIKIDAEDED